MFYKEWRQSQQQFIKYLVALILIGWIFFFILAVSPTLPAATHVGLFMGMAVYCLLCVCVTFFLDEGTVTKEYRDGTISFLEVKPVSMTKVFLVKYVVGAIQTIITVVLPLIVIFSLGKPLISSWWIVSPAEWIAIIMAILSVSIASFSIGFFFRVCFEKERARNLPLIIGLFYFVFFFFRYFYDLSQLSFDTHGLFVFFSPLYTVSIVIALISVYLTLLVLRSRKKKRVVREVIRFIQACALALLIIGLVYLPFFFFAIFGPDCWATSVLRKLVFMGMPCTFIGSPLRRLFWIGMPFTIFGSEVIAGLAMTFSILLLNIICGVIAYYDTRRRYSSRVARTLLTAFVLVFSIAGLIAYAFYRRMGKLGPCDSCRREKLVYVYPCPYCGYHIA